MLSIFIKESLYCHYITASPPPQPFVHFYFLAKKRRALNSCANLLFFFPHKLQILPHLPPKHRNILIQHLQHLAQRIHRHADFACLYPAQRTLIQTTVPRQILLADFLVLAQRNNIFTYHLCH